MEVVRSGQVLVYFEDTSNSNCWWVKCRTWKKKTKGIKDKVSLAKKTMRGKHLTEKYQLVLTALFDTLIIDAVSLPGWTEHVVLAKMNLGKIRNRKLPWTIFLIWHSPISPRYHQPPKTRPYLLDPIVNHPLFMLIHLLLTLDATSK